MIASDTNLNGYSSLTAVAHAEMILLGLADDRVVLWQYPGEGPRPFDFIFSTCLNNGFMIAFCGQDTIHDRNFVVGDLALIGSHHPNYEQCI